MFWVVSKVQKWVMKNRYEKTSVQIETWAKLVKKIDFFNKKSPPKTPTRTEPKFLSLVYLFLFSIVILRLVLDQGFGEWKRKLKEKDNEFHISNLIFFLSFLFPP